MAGYLFTFSDKESLINCIKNGTYSPLMKPKWSKATEGTLGDFITMKPGDNVYLFSKRMVYGIGEIIDIEPGKTILENNPKSTNGDTYPNSGEDRIQRWSIVFKPAPHFFKTGIDMDDLLLSNPSVFRSLRVFWKRTFIKLDDEENTAFKAAILRKNLEYISINNTENIFQCEYKKTIKELSTKRTTSPNIEKFLSIKRKKNGSLRTEMSLEIGLLNGLSKEKLEAENAFGHWDYLSHQVHASPMKAIDYMDKIDIFGYRWLKGYEKQIIEKYLIIELKRGTATGDDLFQLMKYVDWVNNEYANKDYLRIKAFLVAKKFDNESLSQNEKAIERNQITEHRPVKNELWNDVTLVSYSVDSSGEMSFAVVPF